MKIINAYSGNDSVAESLGALANSMFGNQAQQEMYRQNAAKLGRENTAAVAGANAFRQQNWQELGAQSYMGGRSAGDAAGYNLLGNTQQNPDPRAPTTVAAQIAAHEPYQNTAVGVDQAEANRVRIAKMQSDRMMEAERYKTDTTPIIVQGSNGPVYTTQRQAPGQNAVRTLDQVKAGMLAPVANPQGGGTPGAAPDLSGLTQDQRSMVGLPTGTQHFMNPQTGVVGVSKDGGQTFITPEGQKGTVQGSGMMPVSPEQALAGVRANQMRFEASHAAPSSLDFTNSQIAQDAYHTTGIAPAIATHLNTAVGAIPGISAAASAVGHPEIAPEIQAARQRLDVAANTARTALLSDSVRPSKWSQQQIDEMLPQGHALQNPTTAAKHIGALLGFLGQQEREFNGIITNPNTPPDLMHKAYAGWQQTRLAISQLTAPPGGGAPPPTASQQTAPVPQQGVQPQGPQEQPPAPGARKAPDGNWYVADPARPGKYLMVR